jgi:hypothetical protein
MRSMINTTSILPQDMSKKKVRSSTTLRHRFFTELQKVLIMELEGKKGNDVTNYVYVTFMLLWYPAVFY